MSENTQRTVIQKLLPFRDRILELIESGVVILATGNASDVFCKEIDYVTENIETSALNIFDYTVKNDLFDRYNGKVIGKFDDITIVGFRSQFSEIFGNNDDCYFVECQRGIGMNKGSKLEGFRKNNLFCTHILGPILPLNPIFCEHLIGLSGNAASAAYRDAAMIAYEQRIKEFTDPNVKF
jgi:CobQ-like glutamine amidotransferase family enzyme